MVGARRTAAEREHVQLLVRVEHHTPRRETLEKPLGEAIAMLVVETAADVEDEREVRLWRGGDAGLLERELEGRLALVQIQVESHDCLPPFEVVDDALGLIPELVDLGDRGLPPCSEQRSKRNDVSEPARQHDQGHVLDRRDEMQRLLDLKRHGRAARANLRERLRETGTSLRKATCEPSFRGLMTVDVVGQKLGGDHVRLDRVTRIIDVPRDFLEVLFEREQPIDALTHERDDLTQLVFSLFELRQRVDGCLALASEKAGEHPLALFEPDNLLEIDTPQDLHHPIDVAGDLREVLRLTERKAGADEASVRALRVVSPHHRITIGRIIQVETLNETECGLNDRLFDRRVLSAQFIEREHDALARFPRHRRCSADCLRLRRLRVAHGDGRRFWCRSL